MEKWTLSRLLALPKEQALPGKSCEQQHIGAAARSRVGLCTGLAGGTGSRAGAGSSPTDSRPPSLGCSVGGSPAAPPATPQPACHPPASPAAGPELGGGKQDTLSRAEPCPGQHAGTRFSTASFPIHSGLSPTSQQLMPKELVPCSGRRLGQEQRAQPGRSCARPALTCLVCVEPQDAGMWVLQGAP